MIGKASEDIDIIIRSQFFNTFDFQLGLAARELGYQVEEGKLIILKNCPQNKVQFKRTTIKIGEKKYQIDLRELLDSLKEDAKCRDFTINSIYLDLQDGCLIDYLGGVIDLQKKIIRGCSNPKFVLADKARVLRTFRFEQKLGFTIEEELLKECMVATLSDNDRKYGVSSEFSKILEKKESRFAVLDRLIDCGGILPMVLEAFTCKKAKYSTINFKNDCTRLVQWMKEAEKDLSSIKCPIYGSGIDSTLIFKLMVAFFMLSAIPKQGDWSVQSFENDASNIIRKLFPQSIQEVWLTKTLLLMLVCTKEDNRVSASALNELIISQLPLTLVLAMQICFNLSQKAAHVIKSAAAAYKVHQAISL